jgi:glucose/arabinose dehydrogenase
MSLNHLTLWLRFVLLFALTWPFASLAGAEALQVSLIHIASGFDKPLHLMHAGDGSKRLFIVEQAGRIIVLKGGERRIFLDIRDQVSAGGEKGLLSVAFHPLFAQNGRFFVNYTAGGLLGLRTVVSEFHALNKDIADAASERVILTVAQPYPNHNGGQIAFGPDGYLYIGMGDGGWANDPKGHGQNPGTLLGSILRIDVDGRYAGTSYRVPADNPFVGRKGMRPEIWAYGLRNPWRFSFDVETGRWFAGDVGQDRREEIDLIEKGRNYGWNIMEGFICTPGVNPECESTGLSPPVIDYGHDQGCSITGGYVYRGEAVPALIGAYVYGDYCSGRVWALRLDEKGNVRTNRPLLDTDANISSFGVDESGELYIVDLRGTVFRLAAPQAPRGVFRQD